MRFAPKLLGLERQQINVVIPQEADWFFHRKRQSPTYCAQNIAFIDFALKALP